MIKNPLYKAVEKHKNKILLIDFIGLVLLFIGYHILPIWLIVFIVFLWWIFVIMPATLAIGPIGRKLGKEVNDTAIAQAEAEREKLKKKPQIGFHRTQTPREGKSLLQRFQTFSRRNIKPVSSRWHFVGRQPSC